MARKLDAMGTGIVYGRCLRAVDVKGGIRSYLVSAADAELAFEDTYALNTIASRILSLPPTW